MHLIADHRESEEGWTSELVAGTCGDLGAPRLAPYPTVRESFHVAMAAIRDLADEVGPVMTVHRLDGSAEQWVVLAAREGLADDAGFDRGECG